MVRAKKNLGESSYDVNINMVKVPQILFVAFITRLTSDMKYDTDCFDLGQARSEPIVSGHDFFWLVGLRLHILVWFFSASMFPAWIFSGFNIPRFRAVP